MEEPLIPDTCQRLFGTNDVSSLTLNQYRKLCKAYTIPELIKSYGVDCMLYAATGKRFHELRMEYAEKILIARTEKPLDTR